MVRNVSLSPRLENTGFSDALELAQEKRKLRKPRRKKKGIGKGKRESMGLALGPARTRWAAAAEAPGWSLRGAWGWAGLGQVKEA